MSSTLPSVPVALQEEASRFRSKQLGTRGAAASSSSSSGFLPHRSSRPQTSNAGGPAEGLVQYGVRYTVPPLTLLALEAIVSNFHLKPSLEGVPERFANAIAAKLPSSLDIRLTGPSVSEEMYWRRVCLEERGYNKEEVNAHGGSWKRMALELYLAELLELFGLYVDLPPAYDDEFCRPPLDSSNPQFMACYPKVQPLREDGKPRRERVSQNSLTEPGSDNAIINSGESGWPHLERLKDLSREAVRLFGKSFAWNALSEADKAPLLAALPPGLAPKQGGEEGGAGAGAPGAPVSNKDLYLLPFAVAAERLKAEEDAQAQRQDDIGDVSVEVNGCGGSGKVLREFLTPSGMDYFKQKGRWPIGRRGNSVLHVRSKELQVLLDRVAAAGNAVQWLELEQLPSHLDLELLFSRLPKLASLKVTYGLRHLGMRFDRALFGMRLRDAESLSRCLIGTSTLHTLCLPSNMIDDNTLLTFLPGLLENKSIQHLDLSHNAITSTGLQQLCKKLKQAVALPGSLSGSSSAGVCPLRVLNLSDNKIDERGGRYLARTFKSHGESLRLRELHLRLNELGDDGGRAIADGLRESSTGLRASLKVIDVSANRRVIAVAVAVGAGGRCLPLLRLCLFIAFLLFALLHSSLQSWPFLRRRLCVLLVSPFVQGHIGRFERECLERDRRPLLAQGAAEQPQQLHLQAGREGELGDRGARARH